MTCADINIRDPYILEENGTYYMYGTRGKNFGIETGGFDVYTSTDLKTWSAPIECFDSIKYGMNGRVNWAPEVHKYKGKYYLVFSIRGRARYLVSNKPFDDFERIDDTLIPCAGVPNCAPWGDKLIFTGFEPIDGYAGTMTFKGATADENGKLIFDEV